MHNEKNDLSEAARNLSIKGYIELKWGMLALEGWQYVG